MNRYQVLHLEDEPCFGGPFRLLFREIGMDYKQVMDLSELCAELSGKRYDRYILDGKFPLQKGTLPVFGLEQAIEIIKSIDAQARILVYSNHPHAREVAQNYQVDYLGKGSNIEDILQKLK